MNPTRPHLNGSRGEFLLSFGVIYIVIGLNYTFGDPPANLVKAMAWMPDWSTIQTCGIAWSVSGLIACIFAFTPMPVDRFGFQAIAGWSAAWAIAYFASAVFGYDRGLAGALVFVVLTRAVMLVARMTNPIPVAILLERPQQDAP